ncbi:NlpC/P60 family protein [Roseovarius nubinhibens]|uniref:NLP/P60 hydrolase n=1 Tax=Roseovarius nubinhibens TaxID=314263 RepID=A0A348WEX7_9RHOB|nr:NLP/P60 hydrolase [Roseovarius nubinhibens]
MDRRRHFANDRVAHASLLGQVAAERFAEGTAMRVVAPVLSLYAYPHAPRVERQVLFGQRVTHLETREGWAFLRDEGNGHVGYARADGLAGWARPTHRVQVARTLVFAAPDIKCAGPVPLSLGSQLCVVGEAGRFVQLLDGRYALAAHLAPVEEQESDPVSVAERLLGTPYLWGGNSGFGIDCSGLVQAGLAACGRACPGDSDMQAAELGQSLDEGAEMQRGDLVFWKGHVGMMADSVTLLHANAHHMAVAYEPLRAAIARIAAQGEGPVTARKRLGGLS